MFSDHLASSKTNSPGIRLVVLWSILRTLSLLVAPFAYGIKHGNGPGSFLESWYNYDVEYYVAIVRAGYPVGGITSGFHPLYPWVSSCLNLLFGSPLTSLLIVSSLCSVILTFAFYCLSLFDLDERVSWTATSLLLCWPVSIALFAPYTESLFLLLAVLCFIFARRRKFLLSGVAGGLASLTRQNGIVLCLPLLWEVWEASGREWKTLLKNWRQLCGVVLVPAGYLLWLVYRALAIQDMRPDFSSVQGFIYSVMISPSHYRVFPNQQFLPPWTAMWKASRILLAGHLHWSAYGDVLLGLLFILMLIAGWTRLKVSYRIYSLAMILLALSYHTGAEVNPYTALPRHMLLAFPVFIGFSASYRFRRLSFLLTILIICQELLLCCFVWRTWVL